MNLRSKLPLICIFLGFFVAIPATAPMQPATAEAAQMPSDGDVHYRRYRGEDEVDDDDRGGGGQGRGRGRGRGGSSHDSGTNSGGGHSGDGGSSKSGGNSSGGHSSDDSSSGKGTIVHKPDDSDRF